MLKAILRLLPLLPLILLQPGLAAAQQADHPPSLKLGDAVVTGFSGTLPPEQGKPLPRGKSVIDVTFINPDGPSVRIVDVGKPGYVWDGRLFKAPKTFDVLAHDVGQVFGVALDDAPQPNIYVAATSAFGLNIVSRGRDGQPERRKKGGPGAGWMKGQFGLDLQGGPGGIYKIDGRTGVATLFANVTLDGVPNPGPGLGNLTYDAAHKQLFVSDLYTGMIHRFDLDGKELSHYDHGVTGLTAAKRPPVAFDPKNRPNIASARFDSGEPETWGFAPVARQVWGLTVHNGRLYYAVAAGPQIWSIGIARDGGFADDPRWELDVPAQAGPLPVSDIAFSNRGAMILAQRGLIAGAYDYSAFTQAGEPRVLRFWLKDKNVPSPGRWKLMPEEYAVGFAGTYRNTNGGVALGYGYGRDGALEPHSCEAALWTTGQNLRNNPALRGQLEPGGSLVVHGLQGSPADLVRNANAPPMLSYFIDYDDTFNDPRAAGHIGSVRIYATPCPAGAQVAPVAAMTPIATPIGSSRKACTPTCACPPGTVPEGKDCVKRDCPSPQVADPITGACKCPRGYVMKDGKCVRVSMIQVQVKCTPPMVSNNDGTACVCPQGQVLIGGACVTQTNCTPPLIPGAEPGSCVCPEGTVRQGRDCVTPPPPPPNACAPPMVPGPCTCPEGTVRDGQLCLTPTPIDLKIEKTGGTTPFCPAPNYSFTINVTNLGNGWPGTGSITVTDTVPANMAFGPITSPGWNCPTGVLNPGTTFTCTYTGPAPTANQVLPGIGIPATAQGSAPFPPYTNCATVASTNSSYADSNAANNNSCVTVAKPNSCGCPPPLVLNEDSFCSCPQGQVLVGGACVPNPPVCPPPQIMNVDNICACPNGQPPVGGACGPTPPVCPPPLVMIPGIGCQCPRDEVLVGKDCVKPIVCQPPQVPNTSNTGCVCPGNEVLRRGKCVEPEKPTHKIKCPRGTELKDGECVKHKRERRIEPGDVIRGIPGTGGGSPHGGGGGGGGGAPGKR